MNKLRFEIKNRKDLLDLHRILMTVKFDTDSSVVGAPILAEFCNKIVDILSQNDDTWHKWRNMKNKSFFMSKAIDNALVYYCNKKELWDALSLEEKKEVANNYLSPFKLSSKESLYFIEEVTKELNLKNKNRFIKLAFDNYLSYLVMHRKEDSWIQLSYEEKIELIGSYLKPFTTIEKDVIDFIDKITVILGLD